jgi:hypothetical protein
MPKARGLAAAAVVVLTGLVPTPAAAQCPPGQTPVAEVVGALNNALGGVFVLRPGASEAEPAAAGTLLCQGDQLETFGTGRARVQYADRAENAGPTVVNLGFNTQIKIVKFEVPSLNPSERNILIDLIRGAVRAFTKGWGQGSFNVRSGTSICGGRGTHFSVSYTPALPPAARVAEPVNGTVSVAVEHGLCECPPREIGPPAVQLTDGQVLDISADGTSRVSPLDPARWQQIRDELTADPLGAPPLEEPVPDRTPGAPSLNAHTNGLTLTLSWTAVLDALSYWVEVGTGPGLADLYRAYVSGTQLVTPGPAGTFWATIRAWNTQGFSAKSNPVQFTLGSPAPGPCVAPPTPTNFVRQLANGLLTLNWTGALGATSYQLQAGTTRGSSNAFDGDIGPGPSVTFNVAGVPQVLYFLRLLAKNLCGTSPPTDDLELDLAAAPAPLPPAPPPPAPPPPGPGAGYGSCANASIATNSQIGPARTNMTPQQCMALCDAENGTGGRPLCRSFDYQFGFSVGTPSPNRCLLLTDSHATPNRPLSPNTIFDYYWNRARVTTPPSQPCNPVPTR